MLYIHTSTEQEGYRAASLATPGCHSVSNAYHLTSYRNIREPIPLWRAMCASRAPIDETLITITLANLDATSY